MLVLQISRGSERLEEEGIICDMGSPELAVSTITLARSKREAELITNSLKILSAEKGIASIVVVDGGSEKAFLDRLRAIEGTQVIERSSGTLQDQVKESLQIAVDAGYPYLLYTESNKEQFFRRGLTQFVEQAMLSINAEKNPGVVLASRSPKSFASFPPFQRYEESLTNQLIARLTGEDGVVDYTYGPRILSSTLVPYLDRIQEDITWGWMSFLVVLAKRLGKSVHSVVLDLPCPEEERSEDDAERLFRLSQLKDHVSAITQAMRVELEE